MKNKQTISNWIKKIIGLLSVQLLIIQTSCGQTSEPTVFYDSSDSLQLAAYLQTSYCPKEIALWASGGLSSKNSFGIGYTYFFNPHWGFSVGAEYVFEKHNTTFNEWNDAYETMDIEDNRIRYNASIQNYHERQRIGMLNLPLSVVYQTGNNYPFYTSLGVKFGLPVYGKYGNEATAVTSGYYLDYHQWEIWQNDLGYGVFPIKNSHRKLDLNRSFSGTWETGMKWKVGIGQAFYTGIYMDYDFTERINSSANRFIQYNTENPALPVMNRVQKGKIEPFSIGLKLKLAFSVGCSDLLASRKAYKAMKKSNRYNDERYLDAVADAQPMHPIELETPINVISTPQEVIVEPLDTIPVQSIIAQDTIADSGHLTIAVAQPGKMYNYNLGETAVTVEQAAILDQYAELLADNPAVRIEIIGHTCDLGTETVNVRIGMERAAFAKEYLVGKGIAPDRMTISSQGGSQPKCPNDNEENRKQNRRLEVIRTE
jgi:outer membrane protein OmpA-like peptidoglycan-associated protein